MRKTVEVPQEEMEAFLNQTQKKLVALNFEDSSVPSTPEPLRVFVMESFSGPSPSKKEKVFLGVYSELKGGVRFIASAVVLVLLAGMICATVILRDPQNFRLFLKVIGANVENVSRPPSGK